MKNIPEESTDITVPKGIKKNEHDYAPILKRYLETSFSIKIDKIARANLRLPSGSVIHAKGSKNYSRTDRYRTYWFGLDKNIYDELIEMPVSYMSLSLSNPEKTFVLPKHKLREIFDGQSTKKRPGRDTDRWLFHISEKNERHLLKFNNVDKTHKIEDDYLNNWEQIEDFKGKLSESFAVYLTGYDAHNLDISKSHKILGWEHQPKNISPGDYVFVYNITAKKIESGFRVKSISNNNNPLWFKETSITPQKVVYKFRWDVDLMCDNLGIDYNTIRQLEPFKSNKSASFHILVIRGSANSLHRHTYKPLRDFLLSKCSSITRPRANTIQDVIHKTSLPRETIEELEALLIEKKQVIFYGPPGTSKTHVAREFASYFTGNVNNIRIVQFHPSYSYEDFVEGIRPKLNDNGSSVGGFSIQPGILKELVNICNSFNDQRFLLIIDEINRGNIPKIFGELLYLLEYRDQEISLTYSPTKHFSLPENLYFIGTMNSADRAIAFIDYALRRRFYFKTFYPNYDMLRIWFKRNESGLSDEVINTLVDVNSDLKLGKEYQIGHTYFMVKDLDKIKLKRILDHAIIPLVEQYFFGNKEEIEDIVNKWQRLVPDLRSDYSEYKLKK